MPQAPGLVIFDCDGTLVDTEPIDSEVISILLKELGLDIEPEEVSRRTIGLSDPEIWDEFATEIGRPISADVVARHEAMINERFERSLLPIPGVIDAVQRLVSAGVPVCVASNGYLKKMEITFGLTGLSSYFGENVFSKTQVPRGKPAPDLFLYAAQRMEVPPAGCVVIEDSRPGVQAAVAAGMDVLGYCPQGDVWGLGKLGARTFDDMRRLPSLLGL